MPHITKDSRIDVELTTSLSEMYGREDLAEWELFKGDFINFGFWATNIVSKVILTEKDREDSSKRLYGRVFRSLDIGEKTVILEVGCGQGKGVFLLTHFGCTVYGMDISQSQIDRCMDRHLDELFELKGQVKFFCGPAEKISLPDASVDRVFSLEAMQHFDSVSDFLGESYRVLSNDGKLVVATFLFNKPLSPLDLDNMVTFSNGIDNAILVSELKHELVQKGFNKISIKSIGKNVWEGFDKWISQTSYAKTWNRKWLQLYKDSIIDYYVVEAYR